MTLVLGFLFLKLQMSKKIGHNEQRNEESINKDKNKA